MVDERGIENYTMGGFDRDQLSLKQPMPQSTMRENNRLFGGLHIWFEAAEAFKRETGCQTTVWNPGLQFAKLNVSMPARSASHLTPKRAEQSLRCVRCALAGSPQVTTAENSQKDTQSIADTQESNQPMKDAGPSSARTMESTHANFTFLDGDYVHILRCSSR
ncbi:hypothetical protein PAAG_07258 [Paracoccidioides lutzii Pb01]|uniref:Uncharacterized protein n=1 Tax=Paracoccidioides lutzii (strain ATCC MYA-826 / Pb01) TaxID=502779 RepID=C1H917_PARBA|nr:hypothetical protein PAAG_07258 [Paracoccidioides lutzii Pb01]EEH36840.2 hypothetical protein PAAG_07258 [Paracoccidioides lutzii Pb01]